MRGKLLVISGFSAAGKGTIAVELVKKFDNYVLSISATTRDKRNGEIDGVHYYFVNKKIFEKMIDDGDLLEYAKYVDNYYGTPKKNVINRLNEGKNVILEIEMQGALKVKEIYNEAILVFISPKDAKTQYNRLVNRGRENEKQIVERLKQTIIDADYAKKYDYILINDNLENSILCMQEIVNGIYDKSKNIQNLAIINKLVDDIKGGNYV